MKKRGLEVSFAWLFAIIAGVFILFLAIYASVKVINIEQTEIDLKTGKQIGILLNPLEIGFESVKSTSMSFPVETRIYNECNAESGQFGKQLIKISQKNFNKWTDTKERVAFENKYIFSEEPIEGKKFYIFSKPFEMPFKIGDIIIMSSADKNYCFVDAPDEIKDDLLDIKQKNFLAENCPESSVKICFSGGSDCDVGVDYNFGVVEKQGERVYFEGYALMYAAIFSTKEVYECQVERLMQRTEQLALLYVDKAKFISEKCSSNLNPELLVLTNLAGSLKDSSELNLIANLAEDINEKNEISLCRLW